MPLQIARAAILGKFRVQPPIISVSAHAPSAPRIEPPSALASREGYAATATAIISFFLISAFLSNRFPFIRPLLAFFRLYRVGKFAAQLLLIGEV